MDNEVKLRGGNLRSRRHGGRDKKEDRIHEANEKWNRYSNEGDKVHQNKVAFELCSILDDRARDFYTQFETMGTKQDDSDFLSLGLDYSFLLFYLKYVEHIFLIGEFDIQNESIRQNNTVDDSVPVVFSEHLLQEKFLKGQGTRNEDQRFFVEYLDNKNPFKTKAKSLFLQYRLIWFNCYAMENDCLSMGVFKDFKHNKILIVASSGDSESLKVSLKIASSEDEWFDLSSSVFSEMFVRIFALWTGVFIENEWRSLYKKQVHAISAKFVQKALKRKVAVGYRFDKNHQKDFEQICKNLFKDNPLIDIYANNIHPSFVNYFLNQVLKKRILIKALLQNACNEDENINTSLLSFVDHEGIVEEEENNQDDIVYNDKIKKEKIVYQELGRVFLLNGVRNEIRQNTRVTYHEEYRRIDFYRGMDKTAVGEFDGSLFFSFDVHEVDSKGSFEDCCHLKVKFRFGQYAPELKLGLYTLRHDLPSSSKALLHSVFVDKNLEFRQGMDWVKTMLPDFEHFTEIPYYDNQRLILLADQIEREAGREHDVYVFSLFNHEKMGLFAMLVVLQRMFNALQLAYEQDGIQISREGFFREFKSLCSSLEGYVNFQIISNDKELFFKEQASRLWNKLWQRYRQKSRPCWDLPYLDYPFSYSNYSLKEIEPTYINLQDVHSLHAETFRNIFVFTDEYFFGSYRDKRNAFQTIHLPMRYWVKIDKKTKFFHEQIYFFKMTHLLKRVNVQKSLVSLYYPFLIRIYSTQQDIFYSYLFDCIYLHIREVTWKLREKIDFLECGHKLRMCKREDFNSEFLLYYQACGYDLLDALEKLKVSIYPLAEKHPEFPNFFDEKFYQENLEQKVTHEDWKNQLLILVNGKPLNNQRKQNGELKNTSLKQIEAERRHLRKRIYVIYLMYSLKKSEIKDLKYVVDARLRRGKICVVKDKRQRISAN